MTDPDFISSVNKIVTNTNVKYILSDVLRIWDKLPSNAHELNDFEYALYFIDIFNRLNDIDSKNRMITTCQKVIEAHNACKENTYGVICMEFIILIINQYDVHVF